MSGALHSNFCTAVLPVCTSVCKIAQTLQGLRGLALELQGGLKVVSVVYVVHVIYMGVYEDRDPQCRSPK